MSNTKLKSLLSCLLMLLFFASCGEESSVKNFQLEMELNIPLGYRYSGEELSRYRDKMAKMLADEFRNTFYSNAIDDVAFSEGTECILFIKFKSKDAHDKLSKKQKERIEKLMSICEKYSMELDFAYVEYFY